MCSNIILSTGKERGVLGTSEVVGFQKNSLDFVPGNKLGLIGTSSFQSAKASHCVFKGKSLCENFSVNELRTLKVAKLSYSTKSLLIPYCLSFPLNNTLF